MEGSLNEKDWDLLQKIYEYGGYTTSLSLCSYRNDVSSVSIFYTLRKLSEGGYVKPIPFYSDSRRNVTVFQITAKTCKLFDNPDCYYRKRHEDTYIIRSLIKGHFLFEIARDFASAIVADQSEKLKLLCEDMGCANKLLPRKFNRGIPVSHIEEVLLDLRKSLQKQLLCKASNSLLSFEDNEELVVVHIDKPTANVSAQLLTVIDRYRLLQEQHRIPLTFLIVVDSQKREHSYCKAIERLQKQGYNSQEQLIQVHMKTLTENLGVPPDRVQGLQQKIKEKYSNTREISDEDIEGIPLHAISMGGISAITTLFQEILCLSCGNEEKLSQVTKLFRKLYRLNACGKIRLLAHLRIQIYRISCKFSVG